MTPPQGLERAVKAAGGTRAKLARLLGISMQAVCQWEKAPAARVLEIEKLTGVSRHDLRADLYPKESHPAELAEEKGGWREAPRYGENFAELRVQPDGTVTVPARALEAAGFAKGARFTAHVTGDGEVRLLTGDAAIRYARELVRQIVPEGVDLLEDLRELRRLENERMRRLEGRHD